MTLCGPDRIAAETAPWPKLVTVLDTDPVCVKIALSGSTPLFLSNSRDQMLQAADAVDANSLAGKIRGPLNVRLGDEIKRRFAQGDHDSFERRALAGGDDPGRVARQVIDLTAGERGDRQRAGHLNEFDVHPMLFKQSGVARDEDIQKRNAESGVGHAHLLGVLCQKGRAILQQDDNADRDTDSSVELSK
jgi:hypothetical protein